MNIIGGLYENYDNEIIWELVYKMILRFRDMNILDSRNSEFKYNIWFDELRWNYHIFRNTIRVYIECDKRCLIPLIITRGKIYYLGKKDENVNEIINAFTDRYILFKLWWTDWLNDVFDSESLRSAMKIMNTNMTNGDIVRKVSR